MAEMIFIGLDVGDRRIGVAISDPDAIMALPQPRIQSKSPTLAMGEILKLVHRYDAKHIVVGLPLSLDGSVGPQAQRVMDFVRELMKLTPLPVSTWDERFSTVAAEEMLLEAGFKGKKRRGRVDSMAAAYILQGYLDSIRSAAIGPDEAP